MSKIVFVRDLRSDVGRSAIIAKLGVLLVDRPATARRADKLTSRYRDTR